MPTDPFEARRTGARRLRVLTASLGAAAVVGTGALAWSVAAPSATATTADEADDSTVTSTTSDDDGFVLPSQLPSTTSSSGSHASS
ncbi:MAG: hypothetical protein ABWY29_09820, partial [Blastococcus sp.]